MTRDEANTEALKFSNDTKRIVTIIYDSVDKEKQQLQQQVAYWKLSFNKQCKATRK